ncbi:interferon-inducible protein AIM2 [Talpa occidentalis]|uniref:interferon-inducible protein AIM2 n=1 Tax=Talpa occidentalis TaxID=50954 RepID=UPI0023F8FCE9|nr:interferon-inducible protein AIM2 [Talpa occidentalis]
MESEYKRILLVVGLDYLTDEELKRLKFFLPDEFKISKSKLASANRTEVADLMIQSAGITSAVTKTIRIFKKLNYRYVAENLQEEKEKVDVRYKGEKRKTVGKKGSQAKKIPAAAAPPRNDSMGPGTAPAGSPHIKPEEQQAVAQQEPTRGEGLQKDPLMVMVLKVTKPLEFKTHGGMQKMFHATVANERNFFLVKVFNMELQDKFTPKKTIKISKYHWQSHFLEVNNNTLVCDAESDQQMSVPLHIKRKAGETPKISKLQTQPLGTIVNGLFVIQKKTEKKNHVSFELSDKTGRMEVLVFGEQKMSHCEEGDKLRLTFFELSKSGEKLQLKSGEHSACKVIKAKKN